MYFAFENNQNHITTCIITEKNMKKILFYLQIFRDKWVLHVGLCDVIFLWESPEHVLFADFPRIACPTRDNCAFLFFLPSHVFRKIAVWRPSPRIVVKAWASLLGVAFWAKQTERWVLWKVCLNVMWGFYHSLEVKKQAVGVLHRRSQQPRIQISFPDSTSVTWRPCKYAAQMRA